MPVKFTSGANRPAQKVDEMSNQGHITDRSIANAHWDACGTCKHRGVNGCKLDDITLTVYLGDWILCEEYEQG